MERCFVSHCVTSAVNRGFSLFGTYIMGAKMILEVTELRENYH
jgi:hypothetical protein